MGRILAVLEELTLAENTIVIFTSDNGGLIGPTSNTPLRSGKGYPYEGGIRVPLIVRWPGHVKSGSVCGEVATSVDFLPTLCEAARVKPPADRPIDGVSLMRVVQHQGRLGREAVYWHFPHYRGTDVVPYSIVRAGDWKLIKRYEGRQFELFNLKDDLRESNDLTEQMPQKVRELHERLQRWLADSGAMMPKKKDA
jgi:arylsulfatase A-like enzyme